MRAVRDRAPQALQRLQAARDAEPHDGGGGDDQQQLRQHHVGHHLQREVLALVQGLGHLHAHARRTGRFGNGHPRCHHAHRLFAQHGFVEHRLAVARHALRRQRQDSVAGQQRPVFGIEAVVQAVVLVHQQQVLRAGGQLQPRMRRGGLHVLHDLARDLVQRAVVGDVGEVQRGPVRGGGVQHQQHRQRPQQPRQQLALQPRAAVLSRPAHRRVPSGSPCRARCGSRSPGAPASCAGDRRRPRWRCRRPRRPSRTGG